MICRTRSEAMVSAIFMASGVPRASEVASFAAWSTVTLGGIGGPWGATDRKSVELGKRVDIGGRCIIQKNTRSSTTSVRFGEYSDPQGTHRLITTNLYCA